MQIEHNFSLLPHNTFGMDVLADTIVSYDNAEELSELVRNGKQQLPLPLLHIGEGSNLLFKIGIGNRSFIYGIAGENAEDCTLYLYILNVF